MAGFFPLGIDLSECITPLEFLDMAAKEWIDTTAGRLKLLFRTQGKDGLIYHHVHGKDALRNKTVALFTVLHRAAIVYPATIRFDTNELPDVLKKTYRSAGIGEVLSGRVFLEGRTVTNEWVSETPAEFRRNLENAFNTGTVKADILSLLSSEQDGAAEKVADHD